MRCDKSMMLLYAVTDRSWVSEGDLLDQVEAALKGGVTCVQVREKDLDEESFLKEAIEISALCKAYGVPIIINDNVDIALACRADGVHVGQGDMAVTKVREKVGEDMIIGVSAHTLEEALDALADGADYLGVGAMFATATKANATAVSKGVLKDICHAVNIPVVAIGGIDKANIGQLAGTGVDGVALVSAVFSVEDIEGECRELRQLVEDMVEA